MAYDARSETVSFQLAVIDPGWYEQHWMTEAPARRSNGNAGRAFKAVLRFGAALATGTAFALQRYGFWPLPEDTINGLR